MWTKSTKKNFNPGEYTQDRKLLTDVAEFWGKVYQAKGKIIEDLCTKFIDQREETLFLTWKWICQLKQAHQTKENEDAGAAGVNMLAGMAGLMIAAAPFTGGLSTGALVAILLAGAAVSAAGAVAKEGIQFWAEGKWQQICEKAEDEIKTSHEKDVEMGNGLRKAILNLVATKSAETFEELWETIEKDDYTESITKAIVPGSNQFLENLKNEFSEDTVAASFAWLEKGIKVGDLVNSSWESYKVKKAWRSYQILDKSQEMLRKSGPGAGHAQKIAKMGPAAMSIAAQDSLFEMTHPSAHKTLVKYNLLKSGVTEVAEEAPEMLIQPGKQLSAPMQEAIDCMISQDPWEAQRGLDAIQTKPKSALKGGDAKAVRQLLMETGPSQKFSVAKRFNVGGCRIAAEFGKLSERFNTLKLNQIKKGLSQVGKGLVVKGTAPISAVLRGGKMVGAAAGKAVATSAVAVQTKAAASLSLKTAGKLAGALGTTVGVVFVALDAEEFRQKMKEAKDNKPVEAVDNLLALAAGAKKTERELMDMVEYFTDGNVFCRHGIITAPNRAWTGKKFLKDGVPIKNCWTVVSDEKDTNKLHVVVKRFENTAAQWWRFDSLGRLMPNLGSLVENQTGPLMLTATGRDLPVTLEPWLEEAEPNKTQLFVASPHETKNRQKPKKPDDSFKTKFFAQDDESWDMLAPQDLGAGADADAGAGAQSVVKLVKNETFYKKKAYWPWQLDTQRGGGLLVLKDFPYLAVTLHKIPEEMISDDEKKNNRHWLSLVSHVYSESQQWFLAKVKNNSKGFLIWNVVKDVFIKCDKKLVKTKTADGFDYGGKSWSQHICAEKMDKKDIESYIWLEEKADNGETSSFKHQKTGLIMVCGNISHLGGSVDKFRCMVDMYGKPVDDPFYSKENKNDLFPLDVVENMRVWDTSAEEGRKRSGIIFFWA